MCHEVTVPRVAIVLSFHSNNVTKEWSPRDVDFEFCLFDQSDFWLNLGRIEYLTKDWFQLGFKKCGLVVLMLR